MQINRDFVSDYLHYLHDYHYHHHIIFTQAKSELCYQGRQYFCGLG